MVKTIKKKYKNGGMFTRGRQDTTDSTESTESTESTDINFILTDHALERMEERNITREDIIRILKNKNFTLGLSKDYTKFPEYIREYLEETSDPDKFLKVITNDTDENPTIITVIRNKEIPELLTPTAMKSMEMNKISIDHVIDTIESNPPERAPSPRDSERISFTSKTFPKITVFTNGEKTKVISVFKHKASTKKGGKKSRKKKNKKRNTYKKIKIKK